MENKLQKIRELKRAATTALEMGLVNDAVRYMREASILEREMLEERIAQFNQFCTVAESTAVIAPFQRNGHAVSLHEDHA